MGSQSDWDMIVGFDENQHSKTPIHQASRGKGPGSGQLHRGGGGGRLIKYDPNLTLDSR